jgi:hypothetical protein
LVEEERQRTDEAQNKASKHYLCARKLHEKQVKINVLELQINTLKDWEKHQYKILLMKRN